MLVMKAGKMVSLVVLAGLFAACGSPPSASTTSSTNSKTGLPGMHPAFSYPVADPSLPELCGTAPNEHWSSEAGTSGVERQSGGQVEVTALVVPGGTWTFATAELTGIEHEAGNCFYSANVLQKDGRSELVFGFKDGSGPMNPKAVAAFLRLQNAVVSSVEGPGGSPK
jgi:hypothetical protein